MATFSSVARTPARPALSCGLPARPVPARSPSSRPRPGWRPRCRPRRRCRSAEARARRRFASTHVDQPLRFLEGTGFPSRDGCGALIRSVPVKPALAPTLAELEPSGPGARGPGGRIVRKVAHKSDTRRARIPAHFRRFHVAKRVNLCRPCGGGVRLGPKAPGFCSGQGPPRRGDALPGPPRRPECAPDRAGAVNDFRPSPRRGAISSLGIRTRSRPRPRRRRGPGGWRRRGDAPEGVAGPHEQRGLGGAVRPHHADEAPRP